MGVDDDKHDGDGDKSGKQVDDGHVVVDGYEWRRRWQC